MARKNENREGSPWGALLIGLGLVFGIRYVLDQHDARLDAGLRFWLQLFQYTGAASILIGLGGLYRRWRIREKRRIAMTPSGVYGAADFASPAQCEAAGLMNPKGLYLGVLDGEPLFYGGKAHLLTVAPARQGKGIGVVIPNLLHFQGSVFVTDPKGELAAVTARHRHERLGQTVVILNPWGLHGLPSHRYNPLAPLIEAANDPRLVRGIADEARALALQLLPEPEDPKNRYFREGSRQILRALMLHLATQPDPARCTLPEMWRTLSSMTRMENAIVEMAGSTALNGVIADLGDDLSHQVADNPNQFADFRQGAVQAVDIFDPTGWLGEAVSGSDVEFGALKTGRTSIYLVIPQDRIATHGAWLGLLTRQAITSVARSKGSTPVLFMLDEFANMGKLSGLAESLTALPGLGVRVWMFVQELAELTRLYGPHTAETVLSQAECKQFFAVQSHELAKLLSAALGNRTLKTMSFGLGRYEDEEISENVSETGRPLMSPDEIRLMPKDEQLLMIEALPPIRAKRIPFWLVAPWQDWVDSNPVEGPYPHSRAVVTLRYTTSRMAAE